MVSLLIELLVLLPRSEASAILGLPRMKPKYRHIHHLGTKELGEHDQIGPVRPTIPSHFRHGECRGGICSSFGPEDAT